MNETVPKNFIACHRSIWETLRLLVIRVRNTLPLGESGSQARRGRIRLIVVTRFVAILAPPRPLPRPTLPRVGVVANNATSKRER